MPSHDSELILQRLIATLILPVEGLRMCNGDRAPQLLCSRICRQWPDFFKDRIDLRRHHFVPKFYYFLPYYSFSAPPFLSAPSCRQTISLCDQPPRPTQPGHPSVVGTVSIGDSHSHCYMRGILDQCPLRHNNVIDLITSTAGMLIQLTINPLKGIGIN